MICQSSCKLISGDIDTKECNLLCVYLILVVFALWLLYTFAGSGICSLSFVISLIHGFDGNSSAYAQGLIIPLFYLPIFCIFTFALYRNIKKIDNEISVPPQPAIQRPEPKYLPMLNLPDLENFSEMPRSAPIYLVCFVLLIFLLVSMFQHILSKD